MLFPAIHWSNSNKSLHIGYRIICCCLWSCSGCSSCCSCCCCCYVAKHSIYVFSFSMCLKSVHLKFWLILIKFLQCQTIIQFSFLNYLYKTFARNFVMFINFVFICLSKSSLFTDIVIPFWLPKRGCSFYKLSLSQKSDALPQPKIILVNAKRCFRESKRILHAQIRKSLIYVRNNEKNK